MAEASDTEFAAGETEPKQPLSPLSWLVLAAVTVVPPMFATAFTRFEDIKSALAGILFGVVFIAFGAQVVSGRKFTLTAGRIVAAALAFAFYAVVSLVGAEIFHWGAVSVTGWLVGVAAFVAVLGPGGRPIRFAELSVATAVAASFCGLFGLLDLFGVGLFTPVWDPVGPVGAFDAKEFALPFYAIAIPILVAGVWRNDGPRRILCAAGLLLGAFHFGLLATWTILGIFTGVASVVTLIILALQRFRRFPILLPTVILFVLATVVAAIPLVAVQTPHETNYANALPRVIQSTRKFPDAQIRNTTFATGRWETIRSTQGLDYAAGKAFSLFRESPVFGQGPYGWWHSQTRYPDSSHPFAEGLFEHYPALRTPHNSVLSVLVEFGGAGLLLLLLWFSAVAGITFTALSTKEESEAWLTEHWGLATAAFTGFVFSLFSPGLELAASTILWFVVLGLLTRESAMLNEFKGLSSATTLNAEGRRYDVVIGLGIFPALLGVGMVVVSSLALVSNYHRGLGDHVMLRGAYADVEKHYLAAEDWWPGRGEHYYNIALSKKRSKSLVAAADDIERAAELRPEDARALNLKAYLLLNQKELKAAAETARDAVARFPNYLEAIRAHAVAEDLQGHPEEAVKALEAALERDPPQSQLGRLHAEIAQYYSGPLKQPAKAVPHLEKALNLTDNLVFQKQVQDDLKRARAAAEMERLMREGKAVPEQLRRAAEPPSEEPPFGGVGDPFGGHEGHDH